ncbi:MAG: signal peptidase I [Candidatus Latescibacteria bacterium]|nr:signal peptidase I [Candidatus Latescibacterota bacterium]
MGKTLRIKPKTGKTAGKAGKGSKTGKRRFRLQGYSLALVLVLGVAVLARGVVLQAFCVPSRSMEDTLLLGDFLLVDKITYGAWIPFTSWRLPALAEPEPGDLLVFRHPDQIDRLYLKRCLATAGQVVEIRNKAVYVDGVRQADPPFSKYIDARIFPGSRKPRDNFGPQTVPQGHLFVLGDNRDNSRDSRHWGVLNRDMVVGRPFVVYWSYEPDLSRTGVDLWGQGVRWKRLGAEVK